MSLSPLQSSILDRKKRLFTVSEYERMAESGVLGPDDRTELIQGEIITVTPMGTRHLAVVMQLMELLAAYKHNGWFAACQLPLTLGSRNEPEPDVLLLKGSPKDYFNRRPCASDVLLVIEVSDTSSRFDREAKVPLYARFGVPEVWLVDLGKKHIEVYTQPTRTNYRNVREISTGTLSPEIMRQVKLGVKDIFGL